jgi:hypothetical protein
LGKGKGMGMTAPSPLLFEAWVTPLASIGVAPETAMGIIASFGVRYRAYSVDLEARGDLPATGGDAPSGAVRTFLFVGSVAPCLRAPAPFLFCALASAGTFHESGVGIRDPRSGSAPYGAAGLRLGLELPLTKLAFFLAHADGLATLARHAVQIDGVNAFTLPPVTASVGFGVGVHF